MVDIAGQVDWDERQENPLTNELNSMYGLNLPEMTQNESDLGSGDPFASQRALLGNKNMAAKLAAAKGMKYYG